MPNDVGWTENKLAHSNYAYITYDSEVIGRLENVKFNIEKDVEYDVIIGSGGKPFGQPIVKMTKFTGTFSKGMIKISDIDKIMILDAIGNSHSDYGEKHDQTNFNSANITKFVDTDAKSITIFPVTLTSFAIAFGGVVIRSYSLEVINNKYIKISGEFIGKFIEYYNKVTSSQFDVKMFKENIT